MDNQHRKIEGYTELSQDQIDAMNTVKRKGAELGDLIKEMSDNLSVDHRWIAIGKTDLQKGIMALVRSIAQPDGF